MSVRRSRIGFLLVFALFIFALFLQSRTPRRQVEKPRSGGTLRVRTFTLNPFKTDFDPAGGTHVFILNQIYDGLVRLDKNLSPVGALADYWMISDDGRTYTFFLRKGVKFHHGRELDAEDVKFSLERLVHKETKGAYYQFLTTKVVGAQEYRDGKASEVIGFKVRDKYTFEILWKNPYVSALYLLSMDFCKILPRDLVQSQGRGFFQKPSGTGPFKFAYWLRSPRLDIIGVRLERNNDYFSKKPYLKAIEFSPSYTPEQFLEEKVDIIPYISEGFAGNPGTPGYKSPEQEAGLRALTIKSDIFSLGITSYQLRTNEHPYLFRQHLIGTWGLTPLDQKVTGIDPGISALVMRMMESNPVFRPSPLDILSSLS